jgi:hypothetical protein
MMSYSVENEKKYVLAEANMNPPKQNGTGAKPAISLGL